MKNEIYLIVEVFEEFFGIEVDKIIEVAETEVITPVPNTAPYIDGIMNLRGEVLTVIDLRKKFNLPPKEPTPEDVIIVLDFNHNGKKVKLGAKADSVKHVIDIPFEEISDIPEIGTKYNTEFLNGIIKYKNSFLALLNIEKIFTEDEITVISEAGNK